MEENIIKSKKKPRQKKIIIVVLSLIVTILGVAFSNEFTSFQWQFALIIFLVSLLAIFFMKKKIEWACLAIILSFGSFFTIISPVFDVLDEPAHYARAQHISEGNFFLENAEGTLAFSKDYQYLTKLTGYNGMNRLNPTLNFFDSNLFERKHDETKQIETKIKATRTYGSLMYFPSAAGIYLGKIISNGNLGVMFYLGRFLNLLMYALMAFFAIKFAGNWKLLLGFFSIQHLPIYISASFSQDAFFYGLSLLIFSKFIQLFDKEEKINLKDIAVMTIYAVLMVFTKLPYISLIGLLVFIPFKRYKNKAVYFTNFLAIIIVLITAILWLTYYSTMEATDLPSSVDQAAQLTFIFNHPGKFAASLLHAILDSLLKYKQYFTFGWSFHYSEYAYFVSIAMLGAMLFMYPMKLRHQINGWFKLAVGGVSLAIIVVTNIILYLTFTGVGESAINGVQGRYFYGILILLPFALNIVDRIYVKETLENNDTVNLTEFTFIILSVSILLLVWMASLRIGIYY